MPKKKIFLIIFLILLSVQLTARNIAIDSLNQMIKKSEGEKKLELINKLSNYGIQGHEILEISEVMEKEAIAQNNNKYLFRSYTLKSHYFADKGNINSIKFYSYLANELYNKYNINLENTTMLNLAIGYFRNGHYELSLHYLKKYSEQKSEKNAVDLLNNYLMMTFIYSHLKKYNLAKEMIDKALSIKGIDEIFETNLLIKLTYYDTLMLVYITTEPCEINKVLVKIIRTITITSFTISILLFIILYISYNNNKKQKMKSKLLFKKYEEIDKYISLIKSNTEHENNQTISDGNNLFNKIEDYIVNKEAYKKENLTREDVAKELNTNWRYVMEAIRNATGLTFTDYINKHRLNYARKRFLSDNIVPINNIIFESGFSSLPTFYRLFKAEYGMTPSELQKIQKELKEKITNDE